MKKQQVSVILKQPVKGYGNIGDIVNLTHGFFKYLVARQCVILHTKENMGFFNQKKEDLIKENEEKILIAKNHVQQLGNDGFIIVRQVSMNGQLYGKITLSEIINAMKFHDILKKKMISAPDITTPGVYYIDIEWHPEVHSRACIAVDFDSQAAYNILREHFKNNSD